MEIKFRAFFDGSSYEEDSENYGIKEMMSHEKILAGIDPLESYIKNEISGMSPLMYYTGLKDKHDKEIYEGDIVKVCPDFWMSDEVKIIDVVTMDRFPRFWLENEQFGYEGELLIESDEVVVIGNIYESPELLES